MHNYVYSLARVLLESFLCPELGYLAVTFRNPFFAGEEPSDGAPSSERYP